MPQTTRKSKPQPPSESPGTVQAPVGAVETGRAAKGKRLSPIGTDNGGKDEELKSKWEKEGSTLHVFIKQEKSNRNGNQEMVADDNTNMTVMEVPETAATEEIVEGAENEARVESSDHLSDSSSQQEDTTGDSLPNQQNASRYLEGGVTVARVAREDPSSSSSSLRSHFVKYVRKDGKTHKLFECGVCTKVFRHHYTLARHLPTHTDERNYKCGTCGKAFRQMSTLSQHRAIHSDARPYVCELCQKTFNRVSTLISHRKTHADDKPHKCQVCGKGFHQKGNLKNHVYTHTNERPYKCTDCGRGFNQMSNLMCHRVKSHDVGASACAEQFQFVCGICGQEFSRRGALRAHEEFKHDIKYSAVPDRRKPDGKGKGRKEGRNVKLVYLPNGERALASMSGNCTAKMITPGSVGKKARNQCLQQPQVEQPSITIDRIETRSMEAARRSGQVPFALLKPAHGIPVLVKVLPAPGQKHTLVPATASDLRSAGKVMEVGPAPPSTRAVQIKVPVVATVIQRIGPDGEMTVEVEPTLPKESEEEVNSKVEQEAEESSGAVSPSHIQFLQEQELDIAEEVEAAAAQQPSGVQFLRESADGGYELLTQEEVAQVMSQTGHFYHVMGENQIQLENAEHVVFAEQDEHQQVVVREEDFPVEMVIQGGDTQEVHYVLQEGVVQEGVVVQEEEVIVGS